MHTYSTPVPLLWNDDRLSMYPLLVFSANFMQRRPASMHLILPRQTSQWNSHRACSLADPTTCTVAMYIHSAQCTDFQVHTEHAYLLTQLHVHVATCIYTQCSVQTSSSHGAHSFDDPTTCLYSQCSVQTS